MAKCAWCGKSILGFKGSHGICGKCKKEVEKEIAEAKKKKGRK